MPVKKLVVEEFTVKETDQLPPVGSKYAYFKDPVTGFYYRPKANLVVEGDDLESGYEREIG